MPASKKGSKQTLFILILLLLVLALALMPIDILMGRQSILGAVISKVYVKGIETNKSCTLNLSSGWNLISIACIPQDTSLASVLNPIASDYISIHEYDTGASTDNWKSYNPSMPAWVVQDLSSISEKKGYWIRIESGCLLNVNGSVLIPNTVDMAQGWNLIGYPANNSNSPQNAFSTIDGSYSIVWTYNTTQDQYLYYTPSLAGTLTEIQPVKGYWINMTAGDTLWII
jgi:hypothetical protein